MPSFRYRALDKGGEVVSGEIDAGSSAAVIERLQALGYLPIEAREVSAGGARLIPGLTIGQPGREEITGLTEDIAMLVRGGVALADALAILAQGAARPALARLVRDLNRRIVEGRSFAEALAAHPDLFPQTYVKTVEVAEATGTLEETLDNIARERRRAEALRARVRRALAYPVFLLAAALGVLSFVLFFVIPGFEQTLRDFGAALSPSTEFIFALSHVGRAYGDLILAALALLLVAALFAARSRAAAAVVIRLARRVPGLGAAIRLNQTVRLCGALGHLLGNGVDITTSLRLVRDLMPDRRDADKVERLIAGVRRGERLTRALDGLDLVPPTVVQMLRVGEESGELAAMAARVAGFHEAKLDAALARLTAFIGPAIMIAVSLLVAWVIIAVLTALLSVNDLLV